MTSPAGTALAAQPEAPRPALIAETVSVAVAAQARAAVEARYLMAIRQPRNWLDVRSKLLEACKRPAFARAARYRKPIGSGSVKGASIRFAEEALRAMGNVYIEVAVMYEDETQRIVRVTPTDLEGNVSYPTDLIIQKTVERKQPRDGQDILSSRVNTQGGTVYIVRATEDEVATKQAALVSKAIRTSGLRLLPSDIHDEAMDLCIATEEAADAVDPKAALKKIADAFDSIAVRPLELEKFLGHPLDQTSPAEIRRLREFWRAIEEGETTWADILATAGGVVKGAAKDKGGAALKDAVRGKTAKKEPEPAKADADGVVVNEAEALLREEEAMRENAAANLRLDLEMVESERAAKRDGG